LKVLAVKEHKMLNEAKKHIKEQYILEPDEHINLIDISGTYDGKVYTYFSGVNQVFFRITDFERTVEQEPEIQIYSLECNL